MIITRTPYRVSLAGGGTDLRSFYQLEDGEVFSLTIDKYLYVVVRRQLGLVEHKFRLNYSHVEYRDTVKDIEHPIIREALRLYGVDFPLEITTFSDIPSYTGLGSSSAFAVGLLLGLRTLLGMKTLPGPLAEEAAHVEVDILGRGVGKQDHYAAAFGGCNRFVFHADEQVNAQIIPPPFVEPLTRRLLLVYTGLKRDAHEVLRAQNSGTSREHLRGLKAQVEPFIETLFEECWHQLGQLLRDGWETKKRVNAGVSSPVIDNLYEKALSAGALGGKLLGAGGGGFLLFLVMPEKRAAVAQALAPLVTVPFALEPHGSQVVYTEMEKAWPSKSSKRKRTAFWRKFVSRNARYVSRRTLPTSARASAPYFASSITNSPTTSRPRTARYFPLGSTARTSRASPTSWCASGMSRRPSTSAS